MSGRACCLGLLAIAACGGGADPIEPPASKKQLNESCAGDDQCASGLCRSNGFDSVCVASEPECTPRIVASAPTSAAHLTQGSTLSFSTNPPSGGDHYGEWLHWTRSYEQAARGNYVHNLEHGGVVLINPCPSGCDTLTAALEQIGRDLPQDPLCRAPINARWLVVRDPELPAGTVLGASAWGFSFTAECMDLAAVRHFVELHYGRGPEAVCADGQR